MELIQGSQNKPVHELIQSIDNSVRYFDNENKSQQLIVNLRRLKASVERCLKFIEKIDNFAHEYDFDKETVGNGYRSFVDIFDSAVERALKIGKKLIVDREKYFFRASSYSKYEPRKFISVRSVF